MKAFLLFAAMPLSGCALLAGFGDVDYQKQPADSPSASAEDAAPPSALYNLATSDAGSEDASPTSLDAGTTTLTDGCTLVTHDDGIGETWTDCAPLETYSVTEAMLACVAHMKNESAYCWGGMPGQGDSWTPCPGTKIVWAMEHQAADADVDHFWFYSGSPAGHVLSRSYADGGDGGFDCANAALPIWK